MLVLMDMEWIENRQHFFCPTQISAMHVDSRWNCVDRFDELIKPFDSSCQQWKHVAYSGAESEAFLTAAAGPRVFLKLFRWFRDDDILCWWGEQPALVFQKVVGNLLHRNVDHPMRVIYPAWVMDTTDNHLKVGSPYRLAQDRGILVPAVEHASANDVDAIRALLHGTFTSPAVIRNSLIRSTAHIMTQADFQKKPEKNRPSSLSVLAAHKLFYDTRMKLLHLPNCPKISSLADVLGFDTYKSCIQKELRPCRCCKEAYWQENWRLSQEIIQKCRYNYVNQLGGNLFHRTTCMHVKKIPFMDLRGGIYHENCLKNGLKPCGWCKPSIKQQVDPPHIFTHHGCRSTQQNDESTWLTTRKLTRDEKNALRRHQAAQKERDALAKNTKTKTPTERRDEHTLTQSGYAFWAAIGYQTFHLRNCVKLEHVSGLRGYAKYQSAIRAGLTPCKLCKPSSNYDIKASVPIYQRERHGETVETLNRLCDNQGYEHRFESPSYYIETTVGKWRLNTDTRPVDVYHINLVTSSETTPYHKQHRLFLSLTDTFEYIRRHDSSLQEKIKMRNGNDERKGNPFDRLESSDGLP